MSIAFELTEWDLKHELRITHPSSQVTVYASEDKTWFDTPYCLGCSRKHAVCEIEYWIDAEMLSDYRKEPACRDCVPSMVADASADPRLDHKYGVVVTVSYWWLARHRKGGTA